MAKRSNKGRGTAFGKGIAGTAMTVLLLGFVDLTVNTQMLGLAAAAIATPFVNEPPKDSGDKKLKVTPVALFERMSWGSKLPHDIDTWIRCYSVANGEMGHPITVGYSRKSDGWLDLLRDDQGGLIVNEEQLQSNSTVTQVPPNTVCIFNVHLFHSHGGTLPVQGEILVIQNKDGETESLVANVKFELSVPGQEITLATVGWDEHGNLMSDSLMVYPKVKTTLIATSPPN